ncbi:MAG: nucleotidyltransferase domain-containing protein [Methanomassiliicoccaceae archaeon]|nr:nucleotidyltransferase domain-containing protein [Methanomassiliicoccaceae archaeon]
MFDSAVLDSIIERIVSGFSPDKIVIFGSVANGTATADSDVDILVVMSTELSYYRRSVPIRVAMRGIPVAMDIFVLTPEEYERLRNDESSFASEISKTGVVAYEA